MFYWASIFFVVALASGILGFGGIAGPSTQMAQVLFYMGVFLCAVSLIAGGTRRNRVLP